MSTNNFKVFHDGCSFDRSDKIREISDWPEAVNNLRVCWAGDNKGGNCGQCEKCIRTMLNFLAVSKTIPTSFPIQSIKLINILKIRLNSSAATCEWQLIYNKAKKNNIRSHWVKAVFLTLKYNTLLRIILPVGSPRRRVLTSLLDYLKSLKTK